ncbi:MAG: type II toxin-antitoxin system death-on-curing family toxin [Candidatus Altarchaeum sp.]|nr:type II toxin-antitoxin system death-on-curing family toxin [Candidatus Altarchaeum sp.]
MKIIIPSIEEIIWINKRIGNSVMNKEQFEFLMTKIDSKCKAKKYKELIANIATIFWMDIIQFHPFIDGNKRTATEPMPLFLKKNNCVLKVSLAGKVYMSLKIANNEIKYNNVVK